MISVEAGNADWLRDGWDDLPTERDEFLSWLASVGLTLDQFMLTARSQSMPVSLRRALDVEQGGPGPQEG